MPIDNDKRTYSVRRQGSKFETVARVDGYWVATWFSKRKRNAERKGEQFLTKMREPGRIAWAWHKSQKSPFLVWVDYDTKEPNSSNGK
jgi:hypothetical protein